MGKEAKIGLAVILLLLICLGVVVARRVLNPTPHAQPVADAPDLQRHTAAMRPDADGRPPEHPKTFAALEGPGLAPPRKGEADGNRLPARDEHRWNPAAGEGKPGREPAAAPKPPTPQVPPMPGGAIELREKHSKPGDNDDKPGRAAMHGQAMAGDAGSQAYDPFRGRSLPAATAEAADRPPALPPLRTVDGDGRPPRDAERPGTGRPLPPGGPADRSSYGAGGPPPDAPPAGRMAYGAMPPGNEPPRPPHTAATMTAAPATAPSYPPYGTSYAGPARPGIRGALAAARQARREDGSYEIQPNDSYWTISEKLYGTGAYFKALAEHNRKRIPLEDDLKVGDAISAPDAAQLEQLYPDLCPKASHRETSRPRTTGVSMPRNYGGRSYLAQEGDTLYDIARRELGKASRWVEIYELNRDQIGSDYNYLPPGTQLILPDGDSSPGMMTRRPNPPTQPYYQR